MLDLMKKTVFAGIGMAAMTKEKVEEISRECVAQGQLSEKEGEKFVAELMQRSEESRAELRQQVEKVVENLIQKMELVRNDELKRLENEIVALKEELTKLRGEQASAE